MVSHMSCNFVSLFGSFWIFNGITFFRCGFHFSTSFTICLWMCEAVSCIFSFLFDFNFRVLYFLTFCTTLLPHPSLSQLWTNSAVFLNLLRLWANSLIQTAAILRRWQLSFSELDTWMSFSMSKGMTLLWYRKFRMASHKFRKLTGRLLFVSPKASARKTCSLNSLSYTIPGKFYTHTHSGCRILDVHSINFLNLNKLKGFLE